MSADGQDHDRFERPAGPPPVPPPLGLYRSVLFPDPGPGPADTREEAGDGDALGD